MNQDIHELIGEQLFEEIIVNLKYSLTNKNHILYNQSLTAAHTVCYHSEKSDNMSMLVRGKWLLINLYLLLGDINRAHLYSNEVLEICKRRNLSDFEHAYAYDGMGRVLLSMDNENDGNSFLKKSVFRIDRLSKDIDRDRINDHVQLFSSNTKAKKDDVSYWIGVAPRNQVINAVHGSYVQLIYGSRLPLEKLSSDDFLVYYSPGEKRNTYANSKKFTAIGKIAGETIFQGDEGSEFKPFRRKMQYFPSKEIELKTLISDLSFIENSQKVNRIFRSGLFKIKKMDFELIATSMNVFGL